MRKYFNFVEYWDIGDPIHVCKHCEAFFWYDELTHKDYKAKDPMYSLCCTNGKIKLAQMKSLQKFWMT